MAHLLDPQPMTPAQIADLVERARRNAEIAKAIGYASPARQRPRSDEEVRGRCARCHKRRRLRLSHVEPSGLGLWCCRGCKQAHDWRGIE